MSCYIISIPTDFDVLSKHSKSSFALVSFYFVLLNDERKGPYTIEELAKKYITADILVWHEGMEGWKKAGVALPSYNAEELAQRTKKNYL